MKVAAQSEEFERAAKIRDQLVAMERALESSEAALPESLTADVIGVYRDGLLAAASLFTVRKGAIKGSRSWLIEHKQSLEGEDEISALLVSLYAFSNADEIPLEILCNELPENVHIIEQWLTEKKGAKVDVKIPQRGEKVELLETVKRNAQYALIQFVNKRSADSAVSGQALVEIQEALGLSQPPLRIECFDISNISGTSVVASMVVFEDGVPKKKDYRRFIIDTTTAWDDTRSINQVISRRIRRLQDEASVDAKEVNESGGGRSKFSYPPQLIVVDGGGPQVAAAQRALQDAGVDGIALCGLAKRLEEVWLPGESDPLILPRSSEGLYLLQRIRDEAHRFAITFHRSRRSRVMLESLLDEIPQLGQVRRRALLDRFGSVAAVRRASVDEIAKIPGIGVSIARIIEEHLSKLGEVAFDAQTGEILNGS
jgi:excinuclease ABC subunit C